METKNNIGFNYQKELADQTEEDLVFAGKPLTGLADNIGILVSAVHAWTQPINGVYPRTLNALNHAIIIISELVRKYLPFGTVQRGKQDWMNCASNAPNNNIEAQHNYCIENNLFSPELIQWFKDVGLINPSNGKFETADAFTSIGSGTTRNGNSLKAPLQFIENNGVIPKSMLPDNQSMTFDEYCDPKRITQKMKDLGLEHHKRVPINYKRKTRQEFELIIDKPRWDIFDSYVDPVDGDFIKRLAPDFAFYSVAYQVFINENTTQQQISIIKRMINLLLEVIGLKKKQIEIIKPTQPEPEPTQNEVIYQTAKSLLGKKLFTMDALLGCAEALNEVFIKATGSPIGGTNSTHRMYQELIKEKKFKEIAEPITGCVIISPTGYGNGRIENGHCGVVGNTCIMSNNSDTGLWDSHWTLERWKAYFGFKGNYPVKFFVLK